MELNKENVAIIAAAGLLVGTLITNFISLLLHFCKERSELLKQRKSLQRDKGEELYRLILLKKEYASTSHIHWVSVIDGNLTYQHFCELTKNASTDNPDLKNLAIRTQLLGGIYFPHIHERLEKATDILEEANEIYFRLYDLNSIKDPKKARLIILNASHKYNHEVELILKALADKIQKNYI